MLHHSRSADRRRTTPALAAAGIATVALATAGTLLATLPAQAATPPTSPVAPSFSVGDNPVDVAVATYAHRAYVAQDDAIAVVDTSSHSVVADVPTGLTDQTSIAMVQSGAKYYAGSFTSNRLAIFDPATNTVTGSVRVGTGTTDIADVVTPQGDYAYITQYGQHFSRVTVVSARTDQVVGRFHLGGDPVTATQAPGFGSVWIGTTQGENVKVVNPRNHQVQRTIAMKKSGPVGQIAFSPNGKRSYVTGLGGLTAVNAANGNVRWFITAPKLFPLGGGINTGPVVVGPHRTLSVVNSTFPDSPGQGTVTTINRVTQKVVGRMTLGVEPTSLAADPMSRQLLATNYSDGSLSYFRQPR